MVWVKSQGCIGRGFGMIHGPGDIPFCVRKLGARSLAIPRGTLLRLTSPTTSPSSDLSALPSSLHLHWRHIDWGLAR